eukprot:351169-Alexandrium_andersonii.AAC.1
MSASLVGSEMCIRDRLSPCCRCLQILIVPRMHWIPDEPLAKGAVHTPVSYTHLTLPTICSV